MDYLLDFGIFSINICETNEHTFLSFFLASLPKSTLTLILLTRHVAEVHMSGLVFHTLARMTAQYTREAYREVHTFIYLFVGF